MKGKRTVDKAMKLSAVSLVAREEEDWERGRWGRLAAEVSRSEEHREDDERVRGLGRIRRQEEWKGDECRTKWGDESGVDMCHRKKRGKGQKMTREAKATAAFSPWLLIKRSGHTSHMYTRPWQKHTHTHEGRWDFLIDWAVPCSDVPAHLVMNELTYDGKEGNKPLAFKSQRFVPHGTQDGGGGSVFINAFCLFMHACEHAALLI